MPKITYVFLQEVSTKDFLDCSPTVEDPDVAIWESEPHQAHQANDHDTRHVIMRGVIAGYIAGRARWAVDIETGQMIYGLDRRGQPLTKAPHARPCQK